MEKKETNHQEMEFSVDEALESMGKNFPKYKIGIPRVPESQEWTPEIQEAARKRLRKGLEELRKEGKLK